MDHYILLALKYVYLSCVRRIKKSDISGIDLKECYLYIKQINDLAEKIKFNKIKDFEEVMKYECI